MAEQKGFKKSLNLLDLTFLSCGCIIGSGWLYSAMNGAVYAGSYAWVSWLIGASMFLLIGLSYAELAAAIPRSGGLLRYPHYSHGSLVGFLVAFTTVLSFTSTIGVEVVAVRQYATYYLPMLSVGNTDTPTLLGFVVEAALVVVFFFINYWSVNFFGKTNTIWTAFKFIIPILAIIFLAFSIHPSNYTAGGADPGGIHGIFKAVVGAGIAFAFLGLRQAVDFAAEARKPQKDVPLAIILSLLACLVLYLMLQFVFIGAIPTEELANGGWASIDWTSPWAKVAGLLGIFWLQNLILIDAVVSPAGTGNVFFSGTARSMFAWAKNGTFYSIFAKLDKRTGLPRGALWLSLLMGIAWTLPDQFQTWGGLINAVSSAAGITYMMGPVAALSFRKTLPDMERPFRLKGMGWIAPLAFVACTFIAYWSGWSNLILLIPLTVGALVLYFAFVDKDQTLRMGLRKDSLASVWLFAHYAFLLAISYLGSFGPGKIIPGPWDTIICGVGAVIIFYWAVASTVRKPDIPAEHDEM